MKSKYLVIILTSLIGFAGVANSKLNFAWPFFAPSVNDHLAVDPVTGGEIAFNSNSQTFYGYNGATWVDLSGASTSNLSVRAVTSTDTATPSDDVLLLSGSSFTETLFTAVSNVGKVLTLVHAGTSLTQSYTLNTTSGQTIGGVASGSYVLHTNGESLKIVSDGTNWQILEHYAETPWTSYTPTFTGLGTVTNIAYRWKRSGSNLIVSGRHQNGTPTGAATISLPSSITVDSTLNASNYVKYGDGTISNNVAGSAHIIGRGGFSTVAPSISTSTNNGLTPYASWSTETQTWSFTVPITGWQP